MGKDMVNHPPHYEGKVECIDALESATAGLEGIEAVDTANAIKYLWRWKKKNGKEDLKKAIWYIKHLLKTLGEPEKKAVDNSKYVPQPQISDILAMNPEDFMREYGNGKSGVVGRIFYSGDAVFTVLGVETTTENLGSTKINIEFERNYLDMSGSCFPVMRTTTINVELKKEVKV